MNLPNIAQMNAQTQAHGLAVVAIIDPKQR